MVLQPNFERRSINDVAFYGVPFEKIINIATKLIINGFVEAVSV